MVPLPYSALTTSKPRTPIDSWLNNRPVRLRRTGSKVSRSTRESWFQRAASTDVARIPIPRVSTTVASRLHVVERTLRNLVHSARSAPAGP